MFSISTLLQRETGYMQRRIKRLISNLNQWLRSQGYPVVQNNDMATYLALHFLAERLDYRSPSAAAIAVTLLVDLTRRYVGTPLGANQFGSGQPRAVSILEDGPRGPRRF